MPFSRYAAECVWWKESGYIDLLYSVEMWMNVDHTVVCNCVLLSININTKKAPGSSGCYYDIILPISVHEHCTVSSRIHGKLKSELEDNL